MLSKLRSYAKRVPLLVAIYKVLREQKSPEARRYDRQEWPTDGDEAAIRRTRILNVLGYTKTSGSSYSAAAYPAGYHEISIDGEVFAGQRSPQTRLKHLPFDFEGKTLLDIGCNQGGMIFAVHDRIKWGVGLDYDHRMINACNLVKDAKNIGNSAFYVFDIDQDPHDLILDLLPESRVDIVFFLAVAMWVEKWRDIVLLSARISKFMVFETNGTEEQQAEQLAFLGETYRDVTLLTRSSEDDAGQKHRQLVLARNA